MEFLIFLADMLILGAALRAVLQELINLYLDSKELYRGIPGKNSLLMFQVESWRRHRRPLTPRATTQWHQKDRQRFLLELRGVYALIHAAAAILLTSAGPLLTGRILTNALHMTVGQVASITITSLLITFALLVKSEPAIMAKSTEIAMKLTGIPPAINEDPSVPGDNGSGDADKPGP